MLIAYVVGTGVECMSKTLKVGIIGGGIGGAALARALQLHGIKACVFERAPAFGEIGAGVQMTPNAVKVLRALGLQTDLDRIGFLPKAWWSQLG